MKKQEDARLAILREYDRWVKDHPNDAKKMGGYVFFGYLEKERPDLLDFRAAAANGKLSPLASSRRSIERLMLNPTFRQTLPDTSVASEKQLRYVAHFTFAHDTLMWLVGTFNLIHKLTVSFWQFSCDDICPSWHVQAKGRTNKQADLELIRRHSAPRSKLRLPHPPS